MNIFKRCHEWDVSRNLVEFNATNEFQMLHEELTEFMAGANNNDTHETIDGLCDIIKVAVSAIYKAGYNSEICMDECLKHIESREQDEAQMDVWDKWGVSGKWLKRKGQTNIYEANYQVAQLCLT